MGAVLRVIRLEDLESFWRFRKELLKLSLLTRPSHVRRRVRRSIEDSIKLALLAREASELFLEVISWRGRRILKLRSL